MVDQFRFAVPNQVAEFRTIFGMGQIRACRRDRGPSQSRAHPAKSPSNNPSKRRASTTTDLAGRCTRARFFLDPLHTVGFELSTARDLCTRSQQAAWFATRRGAKIQNGLAPFAAQRINRQCGSRILNPPITFGENRAWFVTCPASTTRNRAGWTERNRPRPLPVGGGRGFGRVKSSGAPAKCAGFDAGYLPRAPTPRQAGHAATWGNAESARPPRPSGPFGGNLRKHCVGQPLR